MIPSRLRRDGIISVSGYGSSDILNKVEVVVFLSQNGNIISMEPFIQYACILFPFIYPAMLFKSFMQNVNSLHLSFCTIKYQFYA